MARQQNQSDFKGGSDLASSEISDRIRSLESELDRLRKAQANGKTSLKKLGSPEPEGLSLDLDLQKQVLMLTEAMPHMVWISDSEGRTSHANNRFYEFTGIGRQLDDGWAWVNVLHPDDLQEALERGNEAALSNTSFSMELRCKNLKGEYYWHLMHSIPFYDPDTNSTKWFGTTTNIHEQKRAQEQLAESEAQLRTLADAIPHIVFSASADGSVVFWNHRFFEYSGLTPEQSEAWSLLIHPQDRERYMAQLKEVLISGDTFEMEFRLKRAVGVTNVSAGYLWHLSRAVALRDNYGRIIRWFGTWTEIEGQKRNQADNT
jgi:PAS domain S-box-containing protein